MNDKKQIWTLSYSIIPYKDIANFKMQFPELADQVDEMLDELSVVEDFTEANQVIANIKAKL